MGSSFYLFLNFIKFVVVVVGGSSLLLRDKRGESRRKGGCLATSQSGCGRSVMACKLCAMPFIYSSASSRHKLHRVV